MAAIGIVAIVALALLVSAVTLRAQVINVLRVADLYEEMGSPVKLFYSDLLHYRVPGILWKPAIARHKRLFWSFFIVAMVLDICCLYIGWWTAFGRG